MQDTSQGPRIYNLFPLLAGPVQRWSERLPSIADMGFNWVFLNPFHQTGSSGSLYAVKDYYRLDSRLRGDSDRSADELLSEFVQAAERAGIAVMMDLVVNHTARDSALVSRHPEWYVRDEHGNVRSPCAVDPDDAENVTVWRDLAELDYSERPERQEMLDYWRRVVEHYTDLGFHGFRCDAAYKLPGDVWRVLIDAARSKDPTVSFFAETLGAGLDQIAQLEPSGFDYFFNSAKWWDFRADWLLDQYEQFRHVAPSIAFPESHDTERLTRESDGSERESQFWYLFTACFSSGVMMPMGYEYGFRQPLHVVKTRPEDWETPRFDLTGFIAAVNAMKASAPVFNEEGPQQRFTADDRPEVGLLRESATTDQRAAVLVNPDPDTAHALPVEALLAAMERPLTDVREITPLHQGPAPAGGDSIHLMPRAVRVFLAD